jgi:hypothetical protein
MNLLLNIEGKMKRSKGSLNLLKKEREIRRRSPDNKNGN